jgi:apolipoprotein N-acyltransferase
VVARPDRFPAALFAAAGGGVFALASPPTDLYPAVVVGLAVLAATIDDAPTGRRAFGRGIAWGTLAGLIGLRFVPEVIQRFTELGTYASLLALLLLALGQSVPWGLGALVAHALRRRARVPLELAFSAGIYVTVLVPTIFTWTPAGVVSPWPAFVQLADVLGERGVSAIFALGSALLVRALRARGEPRVAARWGLLAVGLFAALGIHGTLRMRSLTAASEGLPEVRVALLNQAVDPLERWDPKNHVWILDRLRELTRNAEAEGAELTVWPEAAYPYPIAHADRRAPRGARSIVGLGVRGPVLAGLITHASPTRQSDGSIVIDSYNSATLVTPEGTLQEPYDKLQLLWFGETVPGAQYFPWLRRVFQKSGSLLPGDAPRALILERTGAPALRLGVLNCYEDTLPSVGRWVTKELRPSLLVNVTNDAWFVGSAEPELHARLAVMRAIEQRRDLVRSVNLGVVSWIDAAGRVRLRHEGTEPAFVIATPKIRDDAITLYASLGDLPFGVLLVLSLAFSARRARREGAAPSRPPEPTTTPPDP